MRDLLLQVQLVKSGSLNGLKILKIFLTNLSLINILTFFI